MKFASILLCLSVTTSALAITLARRDSDSKNTSPTSSAFTATPLRDCLEDWQVTNIVNAFNYLLANPQAANFNATANALLAKDYTDFSDSIDELAGIPVRRPLVTVWKTAPICKSTNVCVKSQLGSVTFASKAAFIAGSGAQPPLILQTLDAFASCDKISWRWVSVSGTGNNAKEVKGIDNFYINKFGRIKTTYAEFNSGAWLYDLGKTQC